MDYIESVWEMDAETFSDPQLALEAVQRLWEQGDDAKCVAFDIAEGLYWHCADYHEGQWSDRYRILCELDYSPGACERSPEEDEEGREAARYVYDLLAQEVGA